jgi:hypothetical protein
MSCVQIYGERLGGRFERWVLASFDSNCVLERIMQIGKKKLVLDHLIVQKMDDEDSVGEDVQSILTFGAKALFESEQESRDIICTNPRFFSPAQKNLITVKTRTRTLTN